MVPVRLTLRNFLSYGEDVPPLVLDGLHMACLSGANGHGKSALLDAMTWALWGQARRAGGGMGRGAASMPRLGSTEMWVDLWFDQEGQRYRVRRGLRSTGKTASSTLDFFLWDGASGAGADGAGADGAGGDWRPLTLPTSRATQERIDALLRMDYGTFINSAFLLQGRADEFTQKTPGERKQVLGEILGLSRYDRLCDMAKSQRNEADRRVQVDRATVDRLQGELRALGDAQAQLAEVDTALAGLETAAAQTEKALDAVRETLAAEQRRRERLAEVDSRRGLLNRELATLESELSHSAAAVRTLEQRAEQRTEVEQAVLALGAASAELERLEAVREQRRMALAERARLEAELRLRAAEAQAALTRVLERQADVEAKRAEAATVLEGRERVRRDLEAYEAARAHLAALDEGASRWRLLRDDEAAAEAEVNAARRDLEFQLRDAGGRLREARPRAERLSVAADALEAARAALAQALDASAAAERLSATESARQTELATLTETVKRLDERLEELAEHERILASGGGRCPVCGLDLDAARREQLLADYAARRDELTADRSRAKAEGRRLRDLSGEAKRELERLAAIAARVTERQREVLRGEQAVTEAQAAAAEVAELQELGRRLKEQLAAPDLGGEAATRLAEARAALQALDYDAADHAHWRRTVEDGRDVVRAGLALEQAEQIDTQCAEALAELAEQVASARRALDEQANAGREREALAAVEAALDALSFDEEAWRHAQSETKRLADAPERRRAVQEAEDQLPSERLRAERLEKRRAESAAERDTLAREAEQLAESGVDAVAERRRAEELDGKLRAARDELARLHGQRGELTATLARLQRQRDELAVVEARLADETKRRTVAEHLVAAFGRDGIPALIIENAVPEIREAANEILGRLTDYRMMLDIRLQRPLKAGGERETLDIDIADELGTRSYENYSGGEAFRVDFALRLALSRLLARRAGARLRTLIIDEGFGTQDDAGLEQLIDAIHAVADEFDLLLVVTHLSALKDRFETRIEVTKDPDAGSRYALIAGGG